MVGGPPVLAGLRKTLITPSDYIEPQANAQINVPGLSRSLLSYAEVI